MTYEYSSYQNSDGLHLSLKFNGAAVWQVSYPCFIANVHDGDLIEDLTLIDMGVMKSVNDTEGLSVYLKQKGIIPAQATVSLKSFAKGGTIDSDTPIIPEIIADQVSFSSVESHKPVKDFSMEQKSSIAIKLTDFLIKKANTLYATNKQFASKINGRGNTGRNLLYMYMEHWAQAWIKKGLWQYAAGGSVTFDDKVKLISQSLIGKKVPIEYQPVYGKIYNKATAQMAARKIASARVKYERKETGGLAKSLPDEIKKLVEADNAVVKSFQLLPNGNWSVFQEKKEYEVTQDYSGNTGDSISKEIFDSLEEAKEHLDSLTDPDSWESAYGEHFAFIEENSLKRRVEYGYEDDEWVERNADEWEVIDYSETGDHKSFGTREDGARDLETHAYFHLRKDVAGEYIVDDKKIIITKGVDGKYASVGIEDLNEEELGSIDIRISDHSYNPKNNNSDNPFISVVVANEDETKNKFYGKYNLYFDKENTYEDIVNAVKERIQDILENKFS